MVTGIPTHNGRIDNYFALSKDIKPTDNSVDNGSLLTEIDTGKKYMYDRENKKWYEFSNGGGSSSGGSNNESGFSSSLRVIDATTVLSPHGMLNVTGLELTPNQLQALLTEEELEAFVAGDTIGPMLLRVSRSNDEWYCATMEIHMGEVDTGVAMYVHLTADDMFYDVVSYDPDSKFVVFDPAADPEVAV